MNGYYWTGWGLVLTFVILLGFPGGIGIAVGVIIDAWMKMRELARQMKRGEDAEIPLHAMSDREIAEIHEANLRSYMRGIYRESGDIRS